MNEQLSEFWIDRFESLDMEPIEPVPGDGLFDVEIPAGGGFKLVHKKLKTDFERWLWGGF